MGELEKFYRGKRVLITGHTGFKGSWLAQILFGWGAKVSGVALRPHTTPNLFGILGLEKKIKNYFADVRDARILAGIFKKEKPEIVFHLAAQALVRRSYDEPWFTVSTNALGTANVLEQIKNSKGVRAGVIITTDKVYKDIGARSYKEEDMLGGHDPYSASKAAADIIAESYRKSFDLPVAVARAGNVIGGGDWAEDRLIPDIIRGVYGKEKKGKLMMRNPGHIRPWQHVLEPLSGYLILAKKLSEGVKESARRWNFGPDYTDALSVLDVVKLAEKSLGTLNYEFKADTVKHETEVLKLDSSLAKKELGWVQKWKAEKAVAATISWYKNYYESPKGAAGATEQEIKDFFK